MCGRYSITKPISQVLKTFDIMDVSNRECYMPHYNACPSLQLPVITNTAPKTLQFYKWGLIPTWAKNDSIGNKLINARSETIHEKPSFKAAFKNQRCLIPADSYYEWKKLGRNKIPYRILLPNEQLFAFAGIWSAWHQSPQKVVHTFTVITTNPHPKVAHIHQRMPVIMTPNSDISQQWLNLNISTKDALLLLQPYQGEMDYYTVSSKVNAVANNTADVVEKFSWGVLDF